MEWILASQSPRRLEILSRTGHAFRAEASGAEESYDPNKNPEHIAVEIASRKAEAVAKLHPDALVIGADTAVWLDREMLGKPESRADAIRMLTSLSGNTHSVVTGIAVIAHGKRFTKSAESTVSFRNLSPEEITGYVDDCAPYDKAGAYGIQELPNGWAAYTGSYDNIVGLPKEELLLLVAQAEETNEL